jgi:predicted CXXCH cytochrome family protein
MKRTIFIALAVLTVSGLAMAQPAMQNSKHDLSTGSTGTTYDSTNVNRICAFCHTPHQAAGASSQDPLWNHTLSTNATYGTYSSNTLNASITELGAATAGSASASHLCLSCHDGTVGVGSLYRQPTGVTPDNTGTKLTGSPNIGTSLGDDHPVNFTYNASLATEDGGLETPDSSAFVDTANQVPLFGGQMQCASCHDPHNAAITDFLVVDNADSALCDKCHTK